MPALSRILMLHLAERHLLAGRHDQATVWCHTALRTTPFHQDGQSGMSEVALEGERRGGVEDEGEGQLSGARLQPGVPLTPLTCSAQITAHGTVLA
ncbi:hypothetical protein GCM10008955_35700 [Deinococcus malanensis]|uniref:Tetratricopeptide repeat protein n=1 Tax=Deinococcus malanensis TaxID=1706855 RepID=A0ABQ2F0N6_9DEIO|nr:hypothetical protein [Deinococcus malanensis]GGK38805.1 hypothetical protein GCM10008955_35700 [Deinococcus malanensis]